MNTQYQYKGHHPGLWSADSASLNFDNDATAVQIDALSLTVQQALRQKPDQWVTVIGGDRHIIEQLVAFGVAESQIRWLRTHSHEQCEWALEQALLAGTSSLVIGYLESVSNRTRQRARMTSKLSDTSYYLFDKNTRTTHLH
jgi:cell division inhibitor SulA